MVPEDPRGVLGGTRGAPGDLGHVLEGLRGESIGSRGSSGTFQGFPGDVRELLRGLNGISGDSVMFLGGSKRSEGRFRGYQRGSRRSGRFRRI